MSSKRVSFSWPGGASAYRKAAVRALLAKDPGNKIDPLAHALALKGDQAAAIQTMDRAVAIIPAAAPGSPVSRQRQEMEAYLATLKRGGR